MSISNINEWSSNRIALKVMGHIRDSENQTFAEKAIKSLVKKLVVRFNN